jgi:DNA modification methylase
METISSLVSAFSSSRNSTMTAVESTLRNRIGNLGDAMKTEIIRESLKGKTYAELGDIYCVHDDGYAWLPNGSIDLVLTDPPFNIARDTNFHTYEKNTINSFRFDAEKGWDSYSPESFRELLSNWAKEFFRVLRPGGSFAVFCADEYISDLISALRSAGLKPRRTLTWRKPNAVPVNRKHMMMSACEYVVLGVKGSKSVFNSDIPTNPSQTITDSEIIAIADKASTVLDLEIRKTLANLNRRPSPQEIEAIVASTIQSLAAPAAKRSTNIYSSDGKNAELCVPNYVSFNSKAGNRLHPTEKPVALLKYLTELLSNEGDLILDPFSGSASAGETAVLTRRRAVLVERDQEFFDKGSKRIRKLTDDLDNELLM